MLDSLWSAGHGGYLVGGGVRDALLGRPVSDWDIATDARPEMLLRIFPGSSYQNRFGTVLARDWRSPRSVATIATPTTVDPTASRSARTSSRISPVAT